MDIFFHNLINDITELTYSGLTIVVLPVCVYDLVKMDVGFPESKLGVLLANPNLQCEIRVFCFPCLCP